MPAVAALLVTAAVVGGVIEPPNVAVTEGIAAYDRGDFTTALTVLKSVVYDVSADRTPMADPRATAYLAEMHRRGQGTAVDWPLSCALFNEAWAATRAHGPAGIGSVPFVEDGIKEVCLPELQPDVNALRTGCYLDGLARQEFVFDGGAWLVVDRRGFHLDLGPDHRDVNLGMRCHERMVSLTQADVAIRDRWSNLPVHFLELFKWTNAVSAVTGDVIRDLHWTVYAVRGVDLGPVIDHIVLTVKNGPYPAGELPAGTRDTVVLHTDAGGHVEWQIKGQPGLRGVIAELPRAQVQASEAAPQQPAIDFAIRFDHKGCHYEYLDMFKGTFSAGGRGPVAFTLSPAQRVVVFNAIVRARIFSLPSLTDAAGGEPADYELEVRNAGSRRTVVWNGRVADRSLDDLVATVLGILNPDPGDGCAGGRPPVRF